MIQRAVRSERGQAAILLLGALAVLISLAAILASFGEAFGTRGRAQRIADLAAISGARRMSELYPQLFKPPYIQRGAPNPRHVDRGRYLALAREAAIRAARRNGIAIPPSEVSFPDGSSFAPTRVAVAVRDIASVPASPGAGRRVAIGVRARAEAELSPVAGAGFAVTGGDGEYKGPFAYRQGKPMRPDTALAFDRMARAAEAAGIHLIVVSAFRSNAEQAALFARHPDPKWVAPPGRSLHRLGTELDLGPRSAWSWLVANCERFGFIHRYPWEPWHFGYGRNPGSRSVGFGAHQSHDGSTLQSFVPPQYAAPLAQAAQRWNISAALLAAQLYAESNFNPFAVSGAGARGIAQFMPGTASAYGLNNPFDPVASIDAQGHLMHDLLVRFASVPLALAAYNAGPAPVASCGCVPPIPETQAYVARILGLLGGAGDLGAGGLMVRLVA